MVVRILDWVLLGSVLVAFGCSGAGAGRDGGDPGTAGTGGTGTGGTGGSGSSIDPAPFLGNWNEAATFVVSGACASVDPITSTGQITVSGGTTSDLVRSDGSCSIPLNLTNASLATLARPVQCFPTSVSGLGSDTVAFETWMFAISGNIGTESASGNLLVQGTPCPFSFSATLTR